MHSKECAKHTLTNLCLPAVFQVLYETTFDRLCIFDNRYIFSNYSGACGRVEYFRKRYRQPEFSNHPVQYPKHSQSTKSNRYK